MELLAPANVRIRVRRVLLSFLFLWLVTSSPNTHAEPMVTTLDSVVKGAKHVWIASFLAPPAGSNTLDYDLVVERVLRGSAAPKSTMRVKAANGHAYFKNGTRIVAFVDGSGSWTAYAKEFAGPSLEDGVLRVEGFYDFNAHLVTPGVMTLAQLEAFVVKGTPLAWTFRGKILLASPTGLAPSSIDVSAQAPSNVVTGMPAFSGFPSPTVHVGSWMGTDATVEWNRTLGRPLVLEASAIGKNPDGSIAVEWRTSYPTLLTEAEFKKYLADPKLGHPYYVLEVATPGTKMPLVLDKEIGRIGTLGTMSISETSLAPNRYIKTSSVTITLAPSKITSRARGTSSGLMDELYAGPIACEYTTAGTSVPCTIRRVDTSFTTN